MNGITELEAAIEKVEKKTAELKRAISGVHIALARIGVEVNQLPDRADS